jgi:hypothetical protein
MPNLSERSLSGRRRRRNQSSSFAISVQATWRKIIAVTNARKKAKSFKNTGQRWLVFPARNSLARTVGGHVLALKDSQIRNKSSTKQHASSKIVE